MTAARLGSLLLGATVLQDPPGGTSILRCLNAERYGVA